MDHNPGGKIDANIWLQYKSMNFTFYFEMYIWAQMSKDW